MAGTVACERRGGHPCHVAQVRSQIAGGPRSTCRLLAPPVRPGLDRHDPGRCGSRRDGASAPKSDEQPAANGTSTAKSPTKPARAITSAPKERAIGRSIPQAIKRQVWLRDQGRCRYRDPVTGRRCTSSHLLQIDHIKPYALGGGSDRDNLRLLCAAHHRYRHAACADDIGSHPRRPPAVHHQWNPASDYAAVVRLLLQAGASVPEGLYPSGQPAIDALLSQQPLVAL